MARLILLLPVYFSSHFSIFKSWMMLSFLTSWKSYFTSSANVLFIDNGEKFKFWSIFGKNCCLKSLLKSIMHFVFYTFWITFKFFLCFLILRAICWRVFEGSLNLFFLILVWLFIHSSNSSSEDLKLINSYFYFSKSCS